MLTMLTAASFLLTSCGDTTGGNTTNANKPANSTNSANSPTNTATSSANTDADVKKLIGDLSAALSKNDTAALDKIYADDYTLVSQTGDVATKAQRLDAMKSGDLKFENVVFSDLKVRSYGDTAVTIGSSSGKSWNKGKESTTNYRVTFVANKTKDGWRIVGAHLSPMPEATKTGDSSKMDESNKSANTNTNANK